MAVKRVRMVSCASDGTTGWDQGLRQNKQSTHQTMKKGRNRCPTQKTKVMERMTPLERWNGLAWVCMEWLWKGLARCGGEGCSGTTVFPQTQRVRLVRLSLCGCDPTTSISSPRTSHGNMGESAQTDDLPRQPSKKYSTSRCFAQRSSRARGPLRGWIQTAWRTGFLPQKSHQRSQSTGCVPVRKAPTNPLSQASANGVCLGEEKASSQKPAQQVKVDGDGASNTRQGVNVQFT